MLYQHVKWVRIKYTYMAVIFSTLITHCHLQNFKSFSQIVSKLSPRIFLVWISTNQIFNRDLQCFADDLFQLELFVTNNVYPFPKSVPTFIKKGNSVWEICFFFKARILFVKALSSYLETARNSNLSCSLFQSFSFLSGAYLPIIRSGKTAFLGWFSISFTCQSNSES